MIVLASATAAVRRRWRAGLRRFAVQEAADARRLAALVAERAPGVAIVDAHLLGSRGASDLPALRRRSPGTRFIVASAAPAAREGLALFRAGARGYCDRDLDPALLPRAVEVVQKGEIWASRALVARLVDALGARAPRATGGRARRLDGLTARERQIAGLVGGGAANKEIASELGVTERTVKAHLTAVFRKLGVTDRLRLAVLLNGAAPPDRRT